MDRIEQEGGCREYEVLVLGGILCEQRRGTDGQSAQGPWPWTKLHQAGVASEFLLLTPPHPCPR